MCHLTWQSSLTTGQFGVKCRVFAFDVSDHRPAGLILIPLKKKQFLKEVKKIGAIDPKMIIQKLYIQTLTYRCIMRICILPDCLTD